MNKEGLALILLIDTHSRKILGVKLLAREISQGHVRWIAQEIRIHGLTSVPFERISETYILPVDGSHSRLDAGERFRTP